MLGLANSSACNKVLSTANILLKVYWPSFIFITQQKKKKKKFLCLYAVIQTYFFMLFSTPAMFGLSKDRKSNTYFLIIVMLKSIANPKTPTT